MESLLDELREPARWQEFRDWKNEHGQLSKKELRELDLFLAEKAWLPMAETLSFSLPEKRILSKAGSNKKRTVYCFNREETWILKMLAWLLYRYDGELSENCYSFRRRITAKTAFDRIRKIPEIDDRIAVKLDIRNYFNSIDVPRLLEILKEVLRDDPALYAFLEKLLTEDRCRYNGEVIREKHGAMAGVPLASFFANFYLRSLDLLFAEAEIPYFRYSDDILIFYEDEAQKEKYDALLKAELAEKKLELNPEKLHVSQPGEPWEFLGFSWHRGEIDLSAVTVKKMKAKIRRKARKIRRGMERKGTAFEKAASSMIRSFDYKFFDLSGTNDFTWSRFYFPLLTRTDGLKEIDRCMQEYLRYLSSGRHRKGNFRITYEQLKRLGYTPLTAEYYRWKKENRELRDQ